MNNPYSGLLVAVFFITSLASLDATEQKGSSPLMMIGRNRPKEVPSTAMFSEYKDRYSALHREERDGRETDDESSSFSEEEEKDENRSDDSRRVTPLPFENDDCFSGQTTRSTYPAYSPEKRVSSSRLQKGLQRIKDNIQAALFACRSSDLVESGDLEREDCIKLLEASLHAISELEASTEDQDKLSQLETAVEQVKTLCKITNDSSDKEFSFSEKEEVRFEQLLNNSLKIKVKILDEAISLNHHDSLNYLRAVTTTLTDGIQFPAFLPVNFHMPVKDCVEAGVAANIAGFLVSSQYLQRKLLNAMSQPTRGWMKYFDSLTRQHIDYDYIAYYMAGWAFLKIVKQDPTPLKTFIPGSNPVAATARKGMLLTAFILPSSVARKYCSHFFQTELLNQGTLEAQAHTLTSHSEKGNPLRQASWNVCQRFIPDMTAAFMRSFLSNVYDYHQGKITEQEVFTKSAFSTLVYTGATIGFYTCYRLLEFFLLKICNERVKPCYQNAQDIQKLQGLKKDLSDLPCHSISLVDVNGINPLPSESRFFPTLSDDQISNFSQSLKVLDSPAVNIMGDPLYRCYYYNDDASFQALDRMKLLKKVLVSLKSERLQEKEDAYKAFSILQKGLLQDPSSPGDIEAGFFGRTTSSSMLSERAERTGERVLFLNTSNPSYGSSDFSIELSHRRDVPRSPTMFRKNNEKAGRSKIDSFISFMENFATPSIPQQENSDVSNGYQSLEQEIKDDGELQK